MNEKNKEIYNFIKNKKFIYFVIVIITLYLYNTVKKEEENIHNLSNNRVNNDVNKNQIENDIHLNNSILLNMKINKEQINKLILNEIEKEKIKNKNNNEELKSELWKIETFFVTLFCAIFGGLYYYSNKNIENNQNNQEENYINDDYTRYFLEESEFESLINKGERNDYNYL